MYKDILLPIDGSRLWLRPAQHGMSVPVYCRRAM
jgi:hypothetical protein